MTRLEGFWYKESRIPPSICAAPTDVVFDDFNIVQPDIFVVCDRDRITEDNIRGAPDLVVEVVSPATELKDRREKKKLYEQSGVKEYIIVFPDRMKADNLVKKCYN